MASRNRSRNLSKPKSSKGSSLSDPSPLLGKGAQNGRQKKKGNKAVSPPLSLSLSLSNSLLDLPPNETVPASQPTPREAPRVQGCRAFSRISYRDRGSIYTIPVFLSYLPTHRRLLLLVVEHSRSPLMREHTRERQRQRQKEKMVEGDGKGARDLRTRVTERDRRVSLVGLATNRVFNGEPFAFNPLSPCDLILLQSQDRRNPVHYIYISIPFICHRIGLPERLMVADIELNFSNLTRLDGDISFLPWIPRFSSI